MNIDDKEFIMALLDDIETVYPENDRLYTKIARARMILDKTRYREKEERQVDPRQKELDFSDYRDWHHVVDLEDQEDDD